MTNAVEWRDWGVDDLTVQSLYEILRLRNQVFIVEQSCPYQDIDGQDLTPGHRHIVACRHGQLLAYARLLAPTPEREAVAIGRVIVSAEARGQKLGYLLMAQALSACSRHWPQRPCYLSAQAHLQDFYRQLGFVAVGEVYDEDGIPHIDMFLSAPPSAG
ncbi:MULTISPECIES: GNAT family N-acetyltransferase [Lonsdalea]|uniref:Acyltransferase n=2 Tax=Lonsdalea TaxID=1082702 RepID=A0ACD1JBQ6_9GAMM|nr:MULTISPECIES: GNAT family N-acetyltransferase [Lonsdalea]OSN01623.1 acyltransferase [Lonsdalea populi]QPQ24745.1 GNAT family N-acetyltransferase [Lonsdalea populi]RAT12521.1 acyltransferase [Lonsdalea quercina]RAT20459.1 acyltransferase [Lonsdalea populi]RAT20553.1 acyltransferase [Lonsdalea populi]